MGVGRRVRGWVLLGLAVPLVIAGLVVSAMAAEPTIEAGPGIKWSPNMTTVSGGGAAKIVNHTGVSHGVEWKSGPNTPSCTSGVPVGSTPSASGSSWEGSCTFTQPGTYVFWCTVHGSAMTETVTVPGAGPVPVVKKVSPKKGPMAGGTPVAITGTGFTGATTVSFGSVAAMSVTVNSDSSITAVSPAEPAMGVNVTVSGPGGTSAVSRKDHFRFVKHK
ncbi:MAG TPA: IPT/TIG domain-containing protein [Solirubrobacteraceae bacterium]|jgi:plastocyanin|nr:IPT/TIG domain-containing protein [Solirubrobacteraceae bacterium]